MGEPTTGSPLPCRGCVSPPGVSVGGHSVAPEKVKTPRPSERAISAGRVGRRAPPSGVGRFVQSSWSSVADKECEVAFVRRKE